MTTKTTEPQKKQTRGKRNMARESLLKSINEAWRKRASACPECGSTKGHKLSCVSGNEQARQYQESLERRHQNNTAAELREIRDCSECILCEDHR